MNKIYSIDKISSLSKILHKQDKKIVLAGGCFDLLHPGHTAFLTEAKKRGDILIILLEHDATISEHKGHNRPSQPQILRADELGKLPFVDYILLLPPHPKDSDYDTVVKALKPAIIATTKGDTEKAHKDRQASLIGAEVVEVIDRLSQYSTTQSIAQKTL